MVAPVASKVFMLLGRCVPTSMNRAVAKVKVPRLELDPNLYAYFKKDEYYYVHDPERVAKSGDIVLIEELPSKLTTSITHKLVEVIYKLGDVTDPLTQKKVAGVKRGVVEYRDQLEKKDELFGKMSNRFEYDKAPERGWQEDKKDFSHKKSYCKYHETKEEQPYAV